MRARRGARAMAAQADAPSRRRLPSVLIVASIAYTCFGAGSARVAAYFQPCAASGGPSADLVDAPCASEAEASGAFASEEQRYRNTDESVHATSSSSSESSVPSAPPAPPAARAPPLLSPSTTAVPEAERVRSVRVVEGGGSRSLRFGAAAGLRFTGLAAGPTRPRSRRIALLRSMLA